MKNVFQFPKTQADVFKWFTSSNQQSLTKR